MCLPQKTFRAIAKDLIRCDSAMALLKITEYQVAEMKNLIEVKNNTINILETKDSLNTNLIENLYSNNRMIADELEYARTENTKQRKKLTNFGISAIIFAIIAIIK